MKKNRLLVLAMATILGLGMTACGGTGSSTSDPMDMGDVECTSIKFSRNAVTEIEVGESFDLADYVTVSPSDCKWRVEAKTSNVKVEGTVVTGLDSGDFKVTVYAGSLEQPKNYTGLVISHELAALKKASAKIEKGNYTAILSDGEDALLSAWHNENYFAYITADEDSKDTYVEGLFNTASGKTAEFTIDGDWKLDANNLPTNGNFSVGSRYYATLDLYTMGEGIEFEGDEFEDDADTTEMVISTDNFDAIAPTLVGTNTATLEKALSSTITDIYVAYDDKADTIKFSLTNNGKDLCYLTLSNFGSTSISYVDAYIKDKKEPEQLKNTAFETLMTEAVSSKNYTIKGEVQIGYYDTKEVWHTTDNKSVLNSVYSNWGLAPVTSTQIVDGETSYSIEDENKEVIGYTKKDNTLYYVGGTYTEGKGYKWETEESKSIDSIWTAGLSYTYGGYTSHAALSLADYTSEFMANINWASVETEENVTTAVATPYGDAGYAMALGMALIPMYGTTNAYLMSTLYSTSYPTAKWYDFFNTQEYVVDSTNDTITINTTLEGVASVSNTYYGVRYVVTISDIGESVLPEGFPADAFKTEETEKGGESSSEGGETDPSESGESSESSSEGGDTPISNPEASEESSEEATPAK